MLGLEVNAEKTKYLLLSHHQSAGQDRGIKIPNRSFGCMVQFKCLGIIRVICFHLAPCLSERTLFAYLNVRSVLGLSHLF
jgi:hypothetical protein